MALITVKVKIPERHRSKRLGSARASCACDGALAIAGFAISEHRGQAPRWARALPKVECHAK